MKGHFFVAVFSPLEREVSSPDSGKGQERQLKRLPASRQYLLSATVWTTTPILGSHGNVKSQILLGIFGKREREALRKASVVPFTTEEQGRTGALTGVGRSQGPTSESGPESTL